MELCWGDIVNFVNVLNVFVFRVLDTQHFIELQINLVTLICIWWCFTEMFYKFKVGTIVYLCAQL